MKSYYPILGLVVLFAFANGQSEEQKKFRKQAHKQCLEDSRVDETLVQRLQQQKDFSNDDQALQLYVFCMLRHFSLVTAEGQFLKEVAVSIIPADADRSKVEAALDICMQEQGATPLEHVWKMAKCYHEKNTGSSFF